MANSKTWLYAAGIIVIVVVAWYVMTPPSEPETEGIKILLAYDVGGRGDLSFCDAGYIGTKRAEQDFGIEFDQITPLSLAELEDTLRTVSQSGDYDLIVCLGFYWADAINIVALEFPDMYYVGIDCYIGDKENVLGIGYREQEGCALAGLVAGLLTDTNNVGIVLGAEIPVLWKFEIGYKFGVDYANNLTGKGVTVQYHYTGYFDRPDLGRDSAIAMIDQGADMIFVAAGETGLGGLDAIAERGSPNELPFLIGVDANQDWVHPGQIFTSVRKGIDVGVYYGIQQFVEGTFEGGLLIWGIEEGGIFLSDLNDLNEWLADSEQAAVIESTTGMTIDEVRDAIVAMWDTWEVVDGYDVWAIANDLEDAIVNGDIVVPEPWTQAEIDFWRSRYG